MLHFYPVFTVFSQFFAVLLRFFPGSPPSFAKKLLVLRGFVVANRAVAWVPLSNPPFGLWLHMAKPPRPRSQVRIRGCSGSRHRPRSLSMLSSAGAFAPAPAANPLPPCPQPQKDPAHKRRVFPLKHDTFYILYKRSAPEGARVRPRGPGFRPGPPRLSRRGSAALTGRGLPIRG